MWSPDWEKWGRDRGTNETINPVMLGHMRPSVPTLKSKQWMDFILWSSAASSCCYCGWRGTGGVDQFVNKLLSAAAYFVWLRWSRDGSLISMIRVCVCVCLCVRVGTCSWCVRLFFVYTIYGCLRT